MLLHELKQLKQLLLQRIAELEGKDSKPAEVLWETLPDAGVMQNSWYSQFINEHQLEVPDRVLLISSLATHVAPETFSSLFNGDYDNGHYSELGGSWPDKRNFVPTVQTVLYLLAGNDISLRNRYLQHINGCHLLARQIVVLQNHEHQLLAENVLKKVPQLASEYVNNLLFGQKPRPDFGKNFPASVTTTALSWEDLVVKPYVLKELDRISNWYVGGKRMIESAGGKINGSFPCLFYGSSGAGKTLAVQLLGKKMGVDVFRIDLSMVVSKYIGETEKNLAYLFDRAKGRDWILLFDEADALFGKRTDIKDSKDKWANLEMSYLLQRMEEHQGLTILTTNLRNNLDMALTRRFQSVLYFQRPDKEERKQLWQKLMPLPYTYPHDIAYDGLAHYDLTGADISNVLKAACLDAECRNTRQISSGDLLEAIKREFAKDNRTIN